MSTLKDELKIFADNIGLDLIGITSADPFDRFLDEIENREEHYLERYAYRLDGWRKMAQPRSVVPGAKSVVVMGFFYLKEEPGPEPQCGKMARIVTYGHLGILQRARQVQSFLQKKGYKAVIGAHRKEAAVRAGLGSIGKHNLIMNEKYGSWVAYQSIVTNAEMEPDTPSEDDLCGSCNLCLKACPSSALYEPRRLDPRKCVAYLLTSHDVPDVNLPHLNNYILGCDACQEACPRNRKIKPKQEVEGLLPESIGMYPSLRDLIYMTDAEFQKEIIETIGDKMSSGGVMNRLMKIKVMRAVLKKLMKTLFKGKEVLPETFVHASGNLQVYKRNALIAAGNMGDVSMLDDVRSLKDDEYLGKYAERAERMLSK